MKFARYTFLTAGILGMLILVPQYFLLERTGVDYPPPITHPEYYYGFTGVAIAFQIVFLIVASDPARFRPMMLASIVEKFSFAVAVLVLFLQDRVPAAMAAAGGLDLTLGVLFIVSYLLTVPDRSNNR